jgi:hypothetical protein
MKESSSLHALHVSVERRPSSPIRDFQELEYLQLLIPPTPVNSDESTCATIPTAAATIRSPTPTPHQKRRAKKSSNSVLPTLDEFDDDRSLSSMHSSICIGKINESSVSGLSKWAENPSSPSSTRKSLLSEQPMPSGTGIPTRENQSVLDKTVGNETPAPKSAPKKYRKHSMEPEIFLQLQLAGPKGKLIDPYSRLQVADPSKISEAKMKESSSLHALHVSVERRPSPIRDFQELEYLQLLIPPTSVNSNESTCATIPTDAVTIPSPTPTPPQKRRAKKPPNSVFSTLDEFDGDRSLASFLSSVRIGKRNASSVSGLSTWTSLTGTTSPSNRRPKQFLEFNSDDDNSGELVVHKCDQVVATSRRSLPAEALGSSL